MSASGWKSFGDLVWVVEWEKLYPGYIIWRKIAIFIKGKVNKYKCTSFFLYYSHENNCVYGRKCWEISCKVVSNFRIHIKMIRENFSSWIIYYGLYTSLANASKQLLLNPTYLAYRIKHCIWIQEYKSQTNCLWNGRHCHREPNTGE